MSVNKFLLLTIIASFLFFSCKEEEKSAAKVSNQAHIFYYGWYGNPATDGKFHHWSHDILPHWSDTTWDHAGTFPGGDDIGANFYPALGCYSSNDPSIIDQHMKLMAQAGTGVVVMSWWGKDSYEDRSIARYLDLAALNGLQLAFHIEPFYKSAQELKEQLSYLTERYGSHPALYRPQGKPFYYVYDSYKLKTAEWKKLLHEDGELSVRNGPDDATFIGLWVEENEEAFFQNTGFDGFYTYFASEGFVYGSTPSNWEKMGKVARANDLLFIPCVGPGYLDTRIRPWNSANTKERQGGKYYEKMYTAAVEAQPDYIGITSFNEWHEGSQIEPAIPKSTSTFTYEDYGSDTDPMFYIHKTHALVTQFLADSVSRQ